MSCLLRLMSVGPIGGGKELSQPFGFLGHFVLSARRSLLKVHAHIDVFVVLVSLQMPLKTLSNLLFRIVNLESINQNDPCGCEPRGKYRHC